MYDGDTMTQIFKRTKKCCAKLIRKLTFNTPNPVSMPIKLRSTSTAQYIQQKPNTCSEDYSTGMDRMSVSPVNSCGVPNTPSASRCVETGWDLVHGNEKLPSICSTNKITGHNNVSQPEKQLSLSGAQGTDDDEYQMFHISPKFFLKRDMTKSYMRVGDDSGGDGGGITEGGDSGGSGKRNCNFPPRLGMSNLMASMILTRRDLSKWNKSQDNNSSCCSDDEIVTNMKDGSNDVIGVEARNKVAHNGNIEAGAVDSHSIQNPIKWEALVPGAQLEYRKTNKTNANDMWNNHENQSAGTTTTSFILPVSSTDEKMLTVAQSVRSSRSWSRNNHSSPIAIADRHRSTATAKNSSLHSSEVVFEKVRFDKTKRYLRHTPSQSSIISSPHSAKSSGCLLPLDRSHSSSFSLDDNSFSDNNVYSSSSPSHSFCSNIDACHLENECSYDPNGNCCHLSIDDGDSLTNPSEKAINRINSLRCRKYSETWDSNGNSADSRRILCEEAWNVFENKINTARDKKMTILYAEDAEDYIRSASPRSSSTTLETWIDDEIFDNSFNEELERHHLQCASSFER